jgi:DNA-binding MarR family transcriptional regulator
MNNELYEKLEQLQWLRRKQHIHDHAEFGPTADTTRGQGRILAVLKMKDGISTKDLAYMLGMQVSSLNELLSKLEKGGYVQREPSEQDKRVMLVNLTEKGREEEQQEMEDSSDIFSCLSEDEQKTLEDYFTRIIAVLQAKIGHDDKETFDQMMTMRAHFAEMAGRGFHGHRIHGGHDHHDRHDFRSWFGALGRMMRDFAEDRSVSECGGNN